MLFRCGVVVVVFVGPGRCNTVPHRLPPPPRALRAGHQEDSLSSSVRGGAAPSLAIPIFPGAGCWRICRLGSISPASSG
ncbi:hypothetical protein HBI81_260490 [Parastagonospora nodorum]|nr:hypothetical protein HBI62_245360 [Parastagonospora nodorum]KAH6134237.1 hypothetical protein HBI63_245390 [Parastagonospora nodorum]KAH6510363.1 hypothetical protein HBI81_260490 [Parastagonospora nodorum]